MQTNANHPHVSVIIPCFNEEKAISTALDALHAQSYPITLMDVSIIDGMSEDRTRAVIADWQTAHPDLELQIVDNPDRKIPHALNRGIAAARGPVVLRMDAHSIPGQEYVARCVAHLVAGRGDNVGGRWEVRPSVETYAARAIAIAAGHPLGSGGASYRSGGEPGEVDTVPFGCFYKATLERIGCFDESLLANEDYELNVRLAQSGGKIYFDPAIRCVYFARSSYGLLARQYYNYGYWKARMAKRYPKTLRLRQLLPPIMVLGVGAVAAFSLLGLLAWGLPGLLPLLLLVLAYLGAVSLGVILKGEAVPPRLLPGVVGAIACMHFSWGSGVLRGSLSK